MMSADATIRWIGTIFFFAAVLHTFLVNVIQGFAYKFDTKSVLHRIFLFLGEVEIVFGFWALLFLICLSVNKLDLKVTIDYLEKRDFTEVVFVFVMMCMSYTQPVMHLAKTFINIISKILAKWFFVHRNMAVFYSIFVFGCLSGSFITEPVAMTVCALLIKDYFFSTPKNPHFLYALLALLFVNISIGGTLTIYSAPPILMVARPWGLTTTSIFQLVGWKSIVAILTSTFLISTIFSKDILSSKVAINSTDAPKKMPFVVSAINLAFLILAIMYHKYSVFVLSLFLLFVGFYEVTKDYHKELKIRESLLISFFIGGIIILGGLQSWWISPIIKSTSFFKIFFGTVALSAITDNVAITYLASQIPNLSPTIKYLFLTGAVGAGGLTVIANAPNPIGYRILNDAFGRYGIKPLWLFLWALLPTMIALISFTVL